MPISTDYELAVVGEVCNLEILSFVGKAMDGVTLVVFRFLVYRPDWNRSR